MNQTPKLETDRRSGLDRRSAAPRRAENHLARDLPNMPGRAAQRQEAMLINEISLVLAEKRTSLSVMRTGLAVLALPLSVLSVLIVISRYYDPGQVMYLLSPLLAICAGLTLLGIYMIYSSFRRIHALNRVVTVLKSQNTQLRELSRVLKEDMSHAKGPPVGPDHDF